MLARQGCTKVDVTFAREPRLDRIVERARRRITLAHVARRGASTNAIELGWRIRVPRGRSRVPLFQCTATAGLERFAIEQGREREDLEEDGSEREHIGPRIDRLPCKLLRCHVSGRAERLSTPRDGRGIALGDLRETPIEDVDLAVVA